MADNACARFCPTAPLPSILALSERRRSSHARPRSACSMACSAARSATWKAAVCPWCWRPAPADTVDARRRERTQVRREPLLRADSGPMLMHRTTRGQPRLTHMGAAPATGLVPPPGCVRAILRADSGVSPRHRGAVQPRRGSRAAPAAVAGPGEPTAGPEQPPVPARSSLPDGAPGARVRVFGRGQAACRVAAPVPGTRGTGRDYSTRLAVATPRTARTSHM